MLLAEREPSISPAMVHDRFNLMATTALTGLTCAAHIGESCNTPLAAVMCTYLVADSVWLIVQPEIAGSGGDGASSTSSSGGAVTLLSHHVFALVVSLHALTWAPHTHYTCDMTVIEINTLILMLERLLPEGAPTARIVHQLFVGSWVLLRLLWFPYLAATLALLGDYPSEAMHVACAASLFALTVHQLACAQSDGARDSQKAWWPASTSDDMAPSSRGLKRAAASSALRTEPSAM